MGSQLDPLPLSRVGSRERASKFQLSATWLCGTLKWVSPRDLGARQLWTNLCVMMNLCTKMASDILLNWYQKDINVDVSYHLNHYIIYKALKFEIILLTWCVIMWYLKKKLYKIDLSTWYKPKKYIYTNH